MNRLNTKTALIFILVAAFVALILMVGVYKHNQASHEAGDHNASQRQQYLVASKDIADGERITSADVTLVTWAGSSPIVGAFGPADKARVIGRIASYPLANGMVFTESYLAKPDSSMGLPHKIPDGMRAFSVKTDEVNDLGGFLYPGTKVDLLVAVKSNDKNTARSLSLVQDVEVLATDKQLSPDPSGKPTEARVVTVLVTPDQAQKIALAEQEGAIYFSLRNGSDNDVADVRPTIFSEIGGVPAPEAPEKRKPLATVTAFQPAGTAVETILGTQSSTQLFHGNIPGGAPPAAPQPARDAQKNSGAE